jgi:hypothetical protein
MTVPYCGARELELQVTGEERLVAVIGNPRLYVRTVAGIDTIR